MSKKHKRQNRRKSLPWLIIGLGAVLVVIAGFLFANRAGAGDSGGGTPAIAVDPQKIDYGYVQFGNNKSFTLTVTNNGNGVLRFKGNPYVEVLEGC